jgi:hypothetical protein
MDYVFTLDKNEDATLVAKIVTGPQKNKLVYLCKDTEPSKELLKNRIENLLEFIDDRRYRFSQNRVNELVKCIKNDERPEDDKLAKEAYDSFLQYEKRSLDVKIEGDMIAMPSLFKKGTRDCIYICGCSGSGKSTWIGSYAFQFNKLFPKSNIYMISAKNTKEDEAYDGVKNLKQIDISDIEMLQEITQDGKPYEYFCDSKHENSLVIFDDAEALSKEQEKYIEQILHSLLQIGRSKHINVIISRHVLNNGHKTKVIFNECSKIVVFPNGISRYQLVYCFKHYLGFDKHMIEKILNIKSRWVQLHNHLPRYLVSEHQLLLI